MPEPNLYDDHDKIIRLESNMVTLAQHMNTLVESQRETDKTVRDSNERLAQMIQAHIQSAGHQIITGGMDLTNQNVKQNSEDIKELRKRAEETENVIRLIKAGAAIILPIFTAVVVLIIKLFFHL